MIVAIHQPNYIPWLGYFYKIYASDVFVFHDAVAFSKASFTKRCKIRKAKTSSDAIWLSVPVKRHHTGTPISEIEIGGEAGWILDHFNKIKNTYSGAPYFKEHEEWLRQILIEAQQETQLAHCNAHLIRAFADRLALKTTFQNSSEMSLSGKGSELNLAISKHLKSDTYLAGIGSQNYEDDQAFHDAGIALTKHDIGGWLKTRQYDQGTAVFTGGLSIIDALMHVGGEGILGMFQEFQRSRQSAAGSPQSTC